MTNILSTAELVIYATLSLHVLYLIVKHAPTGLLGWLYLFAFCTLRIVGGAMSMNMDSPSASVISNIGLSPLLLAASGTLHEARTYRLIPNTKLEWILILFIHVVVASGVGLVGSGASALQSSYASQNDIVLVEVGISLLMVSWVILCVWAAASFLPSQHNSSAQAHRHGTKLLLSVTAALPFIGIRVIYSLVALSTRAADLNPITGKMSIRIVLGFLSELVVTITLIFGGLLTRRAAGMHKEGVRKFGGQRRLHGSK